jgi:hypothetical protein
MVLPAAEAKESGRESEFSTLANPGLTMSIMKNKHRLKKDYGSIMVKWLVFMSSLPCRPSEF